MANTENERAGQQQPLGCQECGGSQVPELGERSGSEVTKRQDTKAAESAPTDSVGSGAGTSRTSGSTQGDGRNPNQQPSQRRTASEWSDRFYAILRNATNTSATRCGGTDEPRSEESRLREHLRGTAAGCSASVAGGRDFGFAEAAGARWQGFPTVSPVHRGNDGLPFDVDDLTIPFSKWRTEALKAYGNAIVPQVMYEIFRAIEQTYNAN